MKNSLRTLLGLILLASVAVKASESKDKKKSKEKESFVQMLQIVQERCRLKEFIEVAQQHGNNCVSRYINGAEWQPKDGVELANRVKHYIGWTPTVANYTEMFKLINGLRAKKQQEADAKKKQEKDTVEQQKQLTMLRKKRFANKLGTASSPQEPTDIAPVSNTNTQYAIQAAHNGFFASENRVIRFADALQKKTN